MPLYVKLDLNNIWGVGHGRELLRQILRGVPGVYRAALPWLQERAGSNLERELRDRALLPQKEPRELRDMYAYRPLRTLFEA